MPKYKVYLEELCTYEVTVEAASEDEACEKAEDVFTSGDIKDFPCEVHSRETGHVELLP